VCAHRSHQSAASGTHCLAPLQPVSAGAALPSSAASWQALPYHHALISDAHAAAEYMHRLLQYMHWQHHRARTMCTCTHCRRARGEALVAMKEIPLSDIGIFGATDAERSAGLGRMCKEVEILSSLDHPNIVQVGGRGRSCPAWTNPMLCLFQPDAATCPPFGGGFCAGPTAASSLLPTACALPAVLRVFCGWALPVHRHGACRGARQHASQPDGCADLLSKVQLQLRKDCGPSS